MFFRRLLSHIVISCAVFLLVATYFIWVIDATLLNSKALNASLKNAGVPSAIASALPEKIATNNNEVDPEIKAKIAQIVTPEYVERKINETVNSTTNFIRNGQPQPTIILTDFPGKIREAKIDISEEEAAKFDKPLEINQSGALDKIPHYYQKFELAKYFGIFLFLVLIGLEWIVAEKDKKLRRVGRIFLHAGIWFLLFWLSIVLIPTKVIDKLNSNQSTDPLQQVGISIVDAVRSLLTPQLLGAAVVCIMFAVIIYMLRHGKKHLQTIQEVPTARIRSKAMAKLPTRQ